MFGMNGWIGLVFFVGLLWALGALVRRLPKTPVMWLVKAPIILVIVLLTAILVINVTSSLLH